MRKKIAPGAVVALLTFWTLTAIPLRPANASGGSPAGLLQGCQHCADGTVEGPCGNCDHTTPPSQACIGHGGLLHGDPACVDASRRRRERRRLQRAYAAQLGAGGMNKPGPTGQDSWIRRDSAAGLSLFALLVGLLGIGALIRTLIGKPRAPVSKSRRRLQGLLAASRVAASRVAMSRGSLLYPLGAALVAATLVFAGSGAPSAPTASRAAAFVSARSGASPADRTGIATASTAQAGSFTSAIEIGGQGVTQIGGTAFDNTGNLYVTGGFSGNIVFNTSPQTTLTSTQDYDFYVAKLDPSGQPIWARAANGATGIPQGLSLEGGLAAAVDGSGNVYVGGGFVKTVTFKDAAGNPVATLNGSNDMLNFEPFVAKYDPSGRLLWAKGGMSGSTGDAGDLNNGVNGITDIVVDAAGNPYVAGSFSGNNFLGMSVTGAGKSDMLVARLNPATGAPVWASDVGSSDNDSALGLALDNAGNVYTVGDILGAVTFPTKPNPTTVSLDGNEDTVVVKYDQNGQVLWVTEIGTTGDAFGNYLAVNGAGQVYVAGESDSPVSFGAFNLDGDGFIAKLDSDGSTWLWARGFAALGERVTLDASGNPYLTRDFFTDAKFGAENPSTAQTITGMGDEDQYLAKYDAAGNFKFARAIASAGDESQNLILSRAVDVTVIPIRLILNPVTGALHASGDFTGALTVDNITLDAGANRHAFVAGLDEGFSLSSDPSPRNVAPGASAMFNVKILSSLTSVASAVSPQSLTVSLSATVMPADSSITTSFSANPVAIGQSATLTVNTTAATPPSAYTITITGAAGQTTQTTTLNLVVTGTDFSLGFDSPSVAASAGGKARVTVLINRSGFTGNVTVTPPDPADGIRAKPPDPISTTGDNAVFKMKIGGGVTPGSYQRTFTGKDDSGRTRSATVTIVVQ